MNDPAVDSILFHSYATPLIEPEFFEELAALVKQHEKPIIFSVVGRKDFCDNLKYLAETAGIPAYRELGRCVTVLKGIKSHFTKNL
jgi:acyl-CoA synthetase (NDP forming)